MSDMPAAGDRAPQFEGPTQTGDTFSLDRALQQDGLRALALYFYPKDDTPGCTKQACNLRDNDTQLQASGVAVVGVSGDDEASHERFAEKYDLGFPLVADTDREIMDAYGVYGEKSFYGKKVVGVKRTTFLIAPDGSILHVFKRPKTDAHSEEILARLEKLGV
ncbi:thioredoxin-dependent thiol peroxidase [Rubricoccus marinus]|uniref:thioredoxin-dependent peroxiredoxin n=1 Tax=Rubricoccus marinus TaxID=716817 RepID=A0A259TZB3_9BACT|nr:thioredoxin-dependent thiol peroxidase [Rubricoccus marinus]OZC02937.1 peroxiredoxin [Rubricoccus marinus]